MDQITHVLSYGGLCACGHTIEEIRQTLNEGKTGLKKQRLRPEWGNYPLGLIESNDLESKIVGDYSRFEKLMILAIEEALCGAEIASDSSDTLCIIASTKGNIDLLNSADTANNERVLLSHSAQQLQRYFHFHTLPVVVSNACISGVSALIWAHRYLQTGKYKQVICVGADCVSEFVVSGFQAFMALSEELCKPFDKDRTGLNLGEAAACMILSSEKGLKDKEGKHIVLSAGAIANDANHISGPSRTGEGLYRCLDKIVQENEKIDFISAHGTATPYNDKMESIAFGRMGMSEVPVNSFKAYWGHTLGAAGILETIFCVESLLQQQVYKCLGLDELGDCEQLNPVMHTQEKELHRVLKTASGFGGCNAAIKIERR